MGRIDWAFFEPGGHGLTSHTEGALNAAQAHAFMVGCQDTGFVSLAVVLLGIFDEGAATALAAEALFAKLREAVFDDFRTVTMTTARHGRHG
jgi:hypothetical protein